jgi:hypothetical protein
MTKPTDTPHTPEWMRQTEQLRGELLDMCYAEQFKRWWMAYDMSGGHSSEQVAKAAWIEATRVAKNRTEVGGKHEQNPYGFGELIDEESK